MATLRLLWLVSGPTCGRRRRAKLEPLVQAHWRRLVAAAIRLLLANNHHLLLLLLLAYGHRGRRNRSRGSVQCGKSARPSGPVQLAKRTFAARCGATLAPISMAAPTSAALNGRVQPVSATIVVCRRLRRVLLRLVVEQLI